MTGLRQDLARVTAGPKEKTIHDLLERQLPAIERALPAAIGADRFARLVTTELRRNPALYECSAPSLLGAMMLCAQLGLEPGPLGHAHLVPFKRECTFILGYTGIIELAHRSGRVRSIFARTVYEHDEFEELGGSAAKIIHRPLAPDRGERGTERCWYALAKLAPAGEVFQVVWPSDIETAIKRSPAGRAGSGPWHTDRNAMCLKTAVRRLRPSLPMTATFAQALAADEHAPRFDETEGTVEVPAEEVEA